MKKTGKNENLKILVRVRPFFKWEALNGIYLSTIDIAENKKLLNLFEYHNIELVPLDLI